MLAIKRIGLAAVLAALVVSMTAMGAFADQTVRISEQNWTASTGICQVMKYVLEEKLGVKAKVIQLNGAATWAGMNKGGVDVFSEIWETAEAAGIQKFVKDKKIAEMSLSYPKAPHGWYIPTYVVKEHGIKTIEDLKGKEKIFDINANGKGDIWVGPNSWKVAEQNRIRIRSYGLDFEAIGVEQWAWLATLKEAIAKKKAVIFYYWEPEWLFTQYDLHMVKEPAFDPKLFTWVPKKPAESKIACALPASNVWVAYTTKLKERSPKAYQFFKNWSIPIGQVSQLIALMTDLPGKPKLSAKAAAKKWVEDNPKIVNGWLKGIK